MVTTLIDYKMVIKNFVTAFIIFFGLLCFYLPNTMGSEADLKMRRDKGVIGEKKTIQGEKVYYEESTGITYHVRKKGTFITPKVIGDVAYFGLDGGLGYTFRLDCRDWRYSIKAYWSSPDVTKERVGFSVSLESPDKKILIDVNEINIPIAAPLFTSPTQEQVDTAQSKGYVEDPFLGDERILAAQQAVKWILDKDLGNYGIIDKPIKFTSENIGNKLFVKTEIDIFSKKENVIKKCVIWALNYRGYWSSEHKKRMETWMCRLISDSSDYSSAVAQTHRILETFKFDTGRNVYQDIKD